MTTRISCLLLLLVAVCPSVMAEEWESLIPKTGLTGWEPVGGSGENWSVEDGVLKCNGKPGATWLATKKEYSNFELTLEFNVPTNGNSGVFVRAPKGGAPWVDGIEIQILDDFGNKWQNLQPAQYTGSVYAVLPPTKRVTKKAGEWQTMRIRCDGRTLQVSINGTKVVNTNLDDHKAHFEKVPGLKRSNGFIGLQNHGDQIAYRKIKVRKLSQN